MNTNAATHHPMYATVIDRIAEIMLGESANTPDEPDDLSVEILSIFANLPADSRQSVLDMARIFKANGALADELHALCDAGDMAAVQAWLDAHHFTRAE